MFNNFIARFFGNIIHYLFSVPAYFVISSVFKLSNWEMNSVKAFKKIPPKYKYGIYVASLDSEHGEYRHVDDEVIMFEASLAKALGGIDKTDKDIAKHRLERVRTKESWLPGHDVPFVHLYSVHDKNRHAKDILFNFLRECLRLEEVK